ncbi:hypothetical protein [Streptomyces sp. AC627_RSS907]|uniref:hypothetical protein n=1 Tax=Streptomyces sp. AC627_RSS907 TaxID=2823684 RepID=UPI0020B6473E|nr:hypothetical protein [Streptomyces sp. AC627_RSS907]
MTRLGHIRRLRDSTGPAREVSPPPSAPARNGSGLRTDVRPAPEPAPPTRGPDPDEGPGDDDAGPPRPAGPVTDAEGEEEAGQDGTGARRPRSGLLRRTALATSAAVLLLGGCGFFYGAHQLRSTPSAHNRALTDAEATTRVAGDVGSALARVFSYTPEGLDATERSARSVLAGRAARQYTELIDRTREDLAEQRVTLSTQAVRTGVIELDGDTARLLVFLDQISRRGKDGAGSAAAQLAVTARWGNDQWRIVDISTR